MIKKQIVKITALTSALILMFFCLPVCGRTNVNDISSALYGIIDFEKASYLSENEYIFNSDFLKNASSQESIMFLLSLSRLGYAEDYDAYGAVLRDNVVRSYRTSDKLSPDKATPWHFYALGLMACGINPQDIKDGEKQIDLIKDGVWGRSKNTPLEKDGAESLMRGLILMDAYTTLIPDDAFPTYDRNTIISKIMEYQNADGSFSTTSSVSDGEITALALTALAPYKKLDTVFDFTCIHDKTKKSSTVGAVLTNAIAYLSENQTEDGGFENAKKDNIEITSSVITALCSLGLDPAKEKRFIKNKNTLIDGLLKNRCEDGSFYDGEKSGKSENKKRDNIYALAGLTSYYRFLNKQTSVFDFSDCDFSNRIYEGEITLKESADYLCSGNDISVDEYERIVILLDKAEKYYVPEEEREYIDILKKKADELYERKMRINELNKQGEYLVSPQTLMGSKNTHAAKLFLKQYEELSDADKAKVKNYEEIKEKKSSMRSKTLVMYTLIFVIGILAVALIIFLAYFFVKSSALWEYIYMKFFAGDVIVGDDYDDDVVFEDNFDEEDNGDEPLPYLNNDDFFNYDFVTDEENADVSDEVPLPYVNDDRFADKAPDEDEDYVYFEDCKEEAPLPYVDNEEFFDYDYSDLTAEDDDFKIY